MRCAAYRAPCVNGTNVLGGYWYIGESVAAFLPVAVGLLSGLHTLASESA